VVLDHKQEPVRRRDVRHVLIGAFVAAPFAVGCNEIFDVFFLRPEVAMESISQLRANTPS